MPMPSLTSVRVAFITRRGQTIAMISAPMPKRHIIPCDVRNHSPTPGADVVWAMSKAFMSGKLTPQQAVPNTSIPMAFHDSNSTSFVVTAA